MNFSPKLLAFLLFSLPVQSFAADWFIAGASSKMDSLVFVDASSIKRSKGNVVFWSWLILEGKEKNYKALREIDCNTGKARNIQISVYEKNHLIDTFKGGEEQYIVPDTIDAGVMNSVCSQKNYTTNPEITFESVQDILASRFKN